MAQQPEDRIEVVDGRLIIDVELQIAELSHSRKTMVHYTTHGFVDVGEYQMSLNLTKKRR